MALLLGRTHICNLRKCGGFLGSTRRQGDWFCANRQGAKAVRGIDASEGIKSPNGDRRAVEDDCNDYGLTRSEYMACNEQRARELPPLDPAKREHFGESYDPAKFLQCKKDGYRQGKDCELHALRRLEQPKYWPYPNVPPMKWPDTPTPSTYDQLKKQQLWVTAKDYFEALCKAEAGEFIYRTVEGVDGIYQIRPRATEVDNMRQEDRYVMEDPFGARPTETRFSPPDYLWVGYSFVETPYSLPWRMKSLPAKVKLLFATPPTTESYVRYLANSESRLLNDAAYTDRLNSRYGYVWRAIHRKDDRASGIAGGEIAIVKLDTNEVLAIKRGFLWKGTSSGPRSRWDTSYVCPQDRGKSGMGDVLEFVIRVLKPISG